MKQILLMKTGAFGDMALFSISINAVSMAFPDAQLYLLTSSSYAEMYKDCPMIKKVFTLPASRNPLPFINIVRTLRKKKFDVIFDLQGNLKTNFLAFLLGSKQRVGIYKKPIGKLFLTEGIKKLHNVNAIESQVQFWKKFTNKPVGKKLQIWISDEKRKNLKNYLDVHKLVINRYIVFHTSASHKWKTKLWPINHWINLGMSLAKKGFDIVLVGDKNAMRINTVIANKIGTNVIDLSGKTDFFTLAFVIENAALLITTDSGPMHVGAATGTRTVAIFGPTDPRYHCPSGITFIQANNVCPPCYKKQCEHHTCMKSISPQYILNVIKVENEQIHCII
ncbi:MAG TPA: glycosyltransferase family 9 protein [bacterium]|nr:glycosyltransferase family 9 protein [bacterium]HPO51247.1 glycosyltransferase family 9 protein [bacterium]